PGRIAIGIVKPIDVPPVARDFADGINLVTEKLPIRGRVVCPAWKAAADANDRDRIHTGAFEVFELLAHLSHRGERLAQSSLIVQGNCHLTRPLATHRWRQARCRRDSRTLHRKGLPVSPTSRWVRVVHSEYSNRRARALRFRRRSL